jgi:hypothetical protein
MLDTYCATLKRGVGQHIGVTNMTYNSAFFKAAKVNEAGQLVKTYDSGMTVTFSIIGDA